MWNNEINTQSGGYESKVNKNTDSIRGSLKNVKWNEEKVDWEIF